MDRERVGSKEWTISETVKIWPQEWHAKQIEYARQMKLNRGGARDQKGLPTMFALQLAFRKSIPLWIALFVWIGIQWFANWGQHNGGTLSGILK
jgi:hypothetical protein